MIYPEPILAQLEQNTDSSTLGIVVIGFLFVMLVLALLSTITATIGAFFIRQAAREARKTAEAANAALELANAIKAAAPPSSNLVQSAGDEESPIDVASDPHLVAVIAAAVHSVIGDRPHRIISIRQDGPGWAQEGRRQIFSSHSTRK